MMQSTLHNLKRRPFLIPLLMPLAMLVMAVLLALWLFDARNSTVIVAIRYAEVDAQQKPTPALNAAGTARAKTLFAQLSAAKPGRGLDAIYVTQGLASQQTAAPVAQSMGLAVNVVSSNDWSALASRIARNHPGEVVLVVADPASLHAFLKRATGGDYPLESLDTSSLFVVVRSGLAKTAAIRLRY